MNVNLDAEKRRLILRGVVLLVTSYVFCLVFDPFFFDYQPWILPLRQIYGCMLAAGLLFVCVRLKYVGLLVYLVFTMFAAICFYAYKVFGYSVGFEVVNAALTTNRHELEGFLNYSLYLAFAGYLIAIPGIYAAAVFCFKWKSISLKRTAHILAVALLWIGLYELPPFAVTSRHGLFLKLMDKTMRNNREWFMGGAAVHPDVVYNRWRLPYSNIKAVHDGIKEYCKEIPIHEAERYASKELWEDEQLIIVLVVGESVRGDHVPAGGYSRNTMPLCTANPNVCFFTKMYSFAATTHQSVKGLFAGLVNDKQPTLRTSFAGILKKHGFVNNLYSEDTENITDSRLFYDIFGRYMESCTVCRLPIITVAEKILKELPERSASKQMIVIENGTGHYPYINEDQYDTYFPCNIDWVAPKPSNMRELLINDYDNCIISIDAFCNRLMEGLRDKNAILLYVSDHGQSLGENNKFMHGDNEIELLRHVASFIWFSDEYGRRHPELVKDIKSVKDKLLVHGQIYAMILKLCGIESDIPLDIGDFINGDVHEVEHNLPKSMKIPSHGSKK